MIGKTLFNYCSGTKQDPKSPSLHTTQVAVTSPSHPTPLNTTWRILGFVVCIIVTKKYINTSEEGKKKQKTNQQPSICTFFSSSCQNHNKVVSQLREQIHLIYPAYIST